MRSQHSTKALKYSFNSNKQFDITLDCTSPISTFIRWEVILVGSAESHDYDQILASKKVGPIEVGLNRFVLKTKPPQTDKIPFDEAALSALILRVMYKEQEFNRISYYVSSDIPADAKSFEGLDLSTIAREVDVTQPTIHPKQISWK